VEGEGKAGKERREKMRKRERRERKRFSPPTYQMLPPPMIERV